MPKIKKAVYFFNTNLDVDPVAAHVLHWLKVEKQLDETNLIIDDSPVLQYIDSDENEFYFVPTYKCVCHDYNHYLPIMNEHFSDFDMAGLVTWHEGHNAPDKVLTVHTTGDVDSGNFGNANPTYMHNLLWAMEKNRVAAGLEDFRITTEGTHWSGMINNGGTPELIPQFAVPIVDIEIGSTEESWSNYLAAQVLARSLIRVFDQDNKKLKNLLCVGGTHFEPAFANAILETWEHNAYGITHIIPNQWLVTGQYEDEKGQEKLEACVQSIEGGIAGIAMHDGLKGVYKEQMRILGRKHNVPVFKHQLLRKPADIPWIEE